MEELMVIVYDRWTVELDQITESEWEKLYRENEEDFYAGRYDGWYE